MEMNTYLGRAAACWIMSGCPWAGWVYFIIPFGKVIIEKILNKIRG